MGVGSQDLNIEITLESMARRWCQVNVDINFLLKREIYSPFFGSYHSAFFKLDGISELNQLWKPQDRSKQDCDGICLFLLKLFLWGVGWEHLFCLDTMGTNEQCYLNLVIAVSEAKRFRKFCKNYFELAKSDIICFSLSGTFVCEAHKGQTVHREFHPVEAGCIE